MKTTEVWPSPVLGPSSRKKLGKPATRHAEVGADAVSVPDVVEHGAVPTDDLHVGEVAADLEPGAEDDRVGRALDAMRRRRCCAA